MKKILYISAGAGSGKTTELVNRLVDVLKKHQDIKPSEIMMTTFSRAAANELRERTRAGLLRENLVKHASELDAASIGTIHSICLGFLQKYWYLVGISPEPKQLEENDFKSFADKSINQIVTESDIWQFEQWRKELGITKGMFSEEDYTYWRDLLKTMVEKVRYYRIQNLEDSRNKSEDEIRNCFSRHQFVKTHYDSLVADYLAANATDVKKDGTLTANAQKRIDKIKTYNPLTDGPDDFPSSGAGCIKDINDIIVSYLNSTLGFTKDKEDILCKITDKLFELLDKWNTEFDKFKKTHRLLDYNDMELYFQKLLKYDEVKEDISNRYKLIMVDEYQDCNSIQVNIFDTLSDLIANNSPLDYSSIWVGDPKQAIYGFRGSDTELTKSIGDAIRKNEKAGVSGFETMPLDKSYRSRPDLVGFANDIFVPIFTSGSFGMDKREVELGCGRTDPSVMKGQKVSLRWNLTNKEDELAARLKQMVESKKYKIEENKIVRELQYKDIAILTRDNYSIDGIANSMRQIGIPVCAPEAKSFSRTEIQLLLALLQYANELKYRRHLRLDIIHLLKNESTTYLLNDYIGYIDGKIKEKVNDDGRKEYIYPDDWRDDDQLIKLVEKISKECYAKNMHDTLATFVDRLHLMDVVNRWGDAEIRKENISNFLKRATQYDNHCDQMELDDDGRKFSKFVQYLIDTPDAAALDLDRDAVKVITLHKSKGLGWPVVILYDLDNNVLTTEKIAGREYVGVREQKEDENYWLRVFPPMGKMLNKAVSQALSKELYFISSRERLLKEEARLFYVGFTRARDLLVFATNNDNTQWMDEILNIGKLTSKSIKDKTVEVEYTSDEIPSRIKETYTEIDTSALEFNKEETQHLVNPSKMPHCDVKYDIECLELSGAAFEVNKDNERMSTIGTCIHNIYAAYNDNLKEEDSVEMAQNIITAYGLQDVIDAKKVVNAIKLLYKELKNRFGEPISIGHEVPFALAMEGDQLLHGEIDLLWKTEKGVVLVDFKNIENETPNPEHYFAQMSAYEKAISGAGLNCISIVLYYANHGKMVVLNRQ